MEIGAHAQEQRQPKVESIATDITQKVSTAVMHVVKTTPRTRSVKHMNNDDVAEMSKEFGVKKCRAQLTEVLKGRITSLAADPATVIDECTMGFSAETKNRKTYSSIEFDKVVICLVHILYEQDGLPAVEQQPQVLRSKLRLMVDNMHRVDEASHAAIRDSLQNGGSDARKVLLPLRPVLHVT